MLANLIRVRTTEIAQQVVKGLFAPVAGISEEQNASVSIVWYQFIYGTLSA